MFEIYKELRKHLAVGPPLLLECAVAVLNVTAAMQL
ncbi:hypothetical protein T4A_8163 [Trichinella pseudospiralis]|uniref:Uncharacterized protein n=1 Tax=Trichinella pseudospiralis TaxID=6337 RepID=A0A0V1DJ64_TRIPS|nr:hypothetical protein T4A_8163 [Trichinella pseudospiralis]